MDMFPNQARCEPLVPQVAIDRVVAHFLSRMVRVVRDRVVDLAYQQVLAVVQSGRAFRCHARQCIEFKPVLGLPVFQVHKIFLRKSYLITPHVIFVAI